MRQIAIQNAGQIPMAPAATMVNPIVQMPVQGNPMVGGFQHQGVQMVPTPFGGIQMVQTPWDDYNSGGGRRQRNDNNPPTPRYEWVTRRVVSSWFLVY